MIRNVIILIVIFLCGTFYASTTYAYNTPGDCDNDGNVSIAEYQNAVNMKRGLVQVSECVDTDKDGSVSNSELEIVLNAFLESKISLNSGLKQVAKTVLLGGGPTLDLGTVNGTPGQTVAVPITLTNNGAVISSVAIDITYDSAVLTPTAVAPATKPGLIGAAGTAAGKMITQNKVSAGLYRIGLTSLENTNAIGDGVVAIISFTVAVGSFGNLPLIGTPSASNADGVSVSITGSNGSITSLNTIPPNAPAVTSTVTLTINTRPTWTWTSGGGDGNGTYRYKLDSSDFSSGITETTLRSYP